MLTPAITNGREAPGTRHLGPACGHDCSWPDSLAPTSGKFLAHTTNSSECASARIAIPVPLNVETQGTLTTPEQFGKIALRANPDGSVLHLGDVARVELGAQNEDTETRSNGQTAVGVALYLAPDVNAARTATAVTQTLDRLSERFPPGLADGV